MMNSVKKDMSSCLFSFVIDCCSLELLSGLAEIKITIFIEFFFSLPVQIEVLKPRPISLWVAKPAIDCLRHQVIIQSKSINQAYCS